MDGSIQKYMAFVKTVECGSFTKAAEQLSYSQSGISRMINDLEKEWTKQVRSKAYKQRDEVTSLCGTGLQRIRETSIGS